MKLKLICGNCNGESEEEYKNLKFSKEGDTCVCPKCKAINKFEGKIK